MTARGARSYVLDRPVEVGRPDALHAATEAGLFAEADPMLFLVDGMNLLWRAAHGPRAPFPAGDGRDLTPLFRFFSLLRRAVGSWGLFAEVVVCFDGADAWAGRTAIDCVYKSNRDYARADLSFVQWLPEIKAALDAAGLPWGEDESAEADDVIATLAARAQGRRVRILSTDRDFYQLVAPEISVVNPKARPPLVDVAAVRTYGVEPRQWCDFRALSGDPSDGIPGLRGVGPKGAARLLAGGRSLEDLAGLDGLEDALRWRELVRLRTGLPLAVSLCGEPSPRVPSPHAVCRELGLVGQPGSLTHPGLTTTVMS